MNEKLIKYNYLSGLLQYLLQQQHITNVELSKFPKSIPLQIRMGNIQNDIKLLEPAILPLQTELNEWIEKELGGEFKFLIDRKSKMSVN